MKILKVRILNLNSLVGDWFIDFTDPAYSSAGIFAITGTTGAGKSTILDAICLALFGRTPRLERVNQTSNEIMSRLCGECMAEVEFHTSKGSFRCSWSQHRARKKAEAALQPYKHTICELPSGKILDVKIPEVAKRVEEITGMDFERFTRSVLLAQGNFAAFLQAAPDKRSPILEGITGTSIYSEISKMVHRRNADVQNQLELLKAELSGVQLLSDEETEQKRKDLEDVQKTSRSLEKKVEKLQAALIWHQRLQELRKKINDLEPEKEKHKREFNAFAADRARLAAARRALECEAAYSTCKQLRDDLKGKKDALTSANEKLPVLQAQAAEAEDAATIARKGYDAAKAEQIALAPQLRLARELDSQIRECNTLLSKALRDLQETEKDLSAQQKGLDGDQAALADKQEQQKNLQEERAARAIDGELVEQLAAIGGTFAQVREARKELEQALTELSQAEKAKLSADKELEQKNNDHSRRQAAATQAAEQLVEAEAALKSLLGDQPFEARQERREVLRDQGWIVQQAQNCYKKYEDLRIEQEKNKQENSGLRDSIAKMTATLQDKSERRQIQENLVNSLDENFRAAELIANYEENRQQLADGQPCPLCGATEHPFAKGNLPQASAAKQRLNEAKKKQAELTNEEKQSYIDLQGHKKDQAQVAARLAELSQKLPEAIKELNEQLNNIAPDGTLQADTPALAEKLAQHGQLLKDELTSVDQVLKQVRILKQDIESKGQAATQAMDTVNVAARQLQAAEAQVEQSKQNLQMKGATQLRAQDKLENCRQQALAKIQPFDYQELCEEHLDDIYKNLSERRDKWQQLQQELLAIDKDIPVLETRIKQHSTDIDTIRTKQSKQQAEHKGHQDSLAELQAKRKEVLAGKAADDEEARINNLLERVEKERDAAEKRRQEEQQKHAELIRDIDNRKKDISKHESNAEEAEKAFNDAINTQKIDDEGAFLAARLSETDRTRLEDIERKLNNRGTELNSQEETLRTQLAAEKAKALSTETCEELEAQQKQQQEDLGKLLESLGALRNELTRNDEAKKTHREKSEARDAQQRICTKWEALDKLIGASDGKKFRDFVQGLTFETVIYLANQQLQKMSDRYMLMHDRSKPLELNVVDRHQGDEIRSTKNLSGGESFIVSLALALGLSNMASSNVHIDSLFLDEGFGALDENVLDCALEALTSLKQEGKIIGVISHVNMLKERIPTQIQVIPIAEGRSRLKGPGCNLRSNADDK
jgi:exonuclease SbcC